MIGLNQLTKRGDIFYKDGTRYTFEAVGGFDRFTGRGNPDKATTLEAILEDHGAKLYVAPAFDAATMTKTGEIIDAGDYVTEGVRPLTEQELADRTVAALTADMLAMSDQIQMLLDNKARERDYDDAKSVRSYAGYVNGFQTEALGFAQWCADCWITAGQIRDDILAGSRTVPTPEEVLAELPTFDWV
jgi:hypothetical protein